MNLEARRRNLGRATLLRSRDCAASLWLGGSLALPFAVQRPNPRVLARSFFRRPPVGSRADAEKTARPVAGDPGRGQGTEDGIWRLKPMRVLITCGPSYEPLDRVRRLTNSSTGELGVALAEQLVGVGAAVVCLKGVGATFRDPAPSVEVERFTTNDDLAERLRRRASTGAFTAVLQVAALCDFRVVRIQDPDGRILEEGKIPSRGSGLCVHLSPAHKLIADLAGLFPKAWVVGWKYEVDGAPADAVRKGQRQMEESGTHACVVNGPACGSQWFLCELPDRIATYATRQELVVQLTKRIQARVP